MQRRRRRTVSRTRIEEAIGVLADFKQAVDMSPNTEHCFIEVLHILDSYSEVGGLKIGPDGREETRG